MERPFREALRALRQLLAAEDPWSAPTVLPWADPAFSRRFAERVDYGVTFGHPPASAQVDVLVRQLALRPGSVVVDLCCGPGPHAIELARRGAGVTGVDIGPGALALASERAAAAGVSVAWLQADVTDAALASTLRAALRGRAADAAFVIRGQADNFAPAALRRVLAGAVRWLGPQGRLLVEFSEDDAVEKRSARHWTVSDAAASIWADHDTLVLAETEWVQARRLQLTRYFVLHPDGALDRYASCVQCFARADLTAWLREAGFGDVRFERGDGRWTRVIAAREG